MNNSEEVFDTLIGTEMSIQQVHFIARRFVQLIGASWYTNCLALLEQLFPQKKVIRIHGLQRFEEIDIDLKLTLIQGQRKRVSSRCYAAV